MLQWFRANGKQNLIPVSFQTIAVVAFRTKITTWAGSPNTANDYTVANTVCNIASISTTEIKVAVGGDSYFLIIGI